MRNSAAGERGRTLFWSTTVTTMASLPVLSPKLTSTTRPTCTKRENGCGRVEGRGEGCAGVPVRRCVGGARRGASAR